MLTSILWKNLSKDQKKQLLMRPKKNKCNELNEKVQLIIDRVCREGDMACKALTHEFDGIALSHLDVKEDELIDARKQINQKTIDAIKKAARQIETFHLPQLMKNSRIETSEGIYCESHQKPIQRVGLYVPGGSAPLVSTVLMLGIPAKIANCPMRVLCSPPQKNGRLNPAILVAAELCGIKKIYKLGGAQAIAAMAYGTETIPKVDKIFGPGNTWVTQAKIFVSQDVSGAQQDMPAGPSEVMVIADSNANPDFIAADLLSQAEHGSDSQVILVCTDLQLSIKIRDAIQYQLTSLSRCSLIENTLQNSSLIIVDNLMDAMDIVNLYAPEHLILQIEKPRQYLQKIQHAGSVFLGPWSPTTAGDYASGTNHVLPTDGYAKNLSGLSVRDFMKTISVQEITKKGLLNIADTIRELTRIEGLEAHQRAVDIRLEEIQNAE